MYFLFVCYEVVPGLEWSGYYHVLHLLYRFKPDYYIKRDVSVVVWTINTQEERNYFEKVLDIPFLTDNVEEMYQ